MLRRLPTSMRDLFRAPGRLDRLVLPAWLATRGLVIALIYLRSDGGDVERMQDVSYYLQVARHVAETTTLPTTDMWQYPPGAALVLVAPLLAGAGAYAMTFVLLMAACDAVITRLLLAAGRRHGSRLGVWAWLLAMPWLREYPLLRFDLVPTLFAVAALLQLARRPALLGLLAGAGALVKAWPIVVLAAEWRTRSILRSVAAAAVTCAVGVGIAAMLLGPQDGVLHNQSARGLQTEAIAATPWHVAAILEGRETQLQFRFGSLQVVGERADEVAAALKTATLVAAALLAGWWALRLVLLRRDPIGRAHLATAAAGVDLVYVGVLASIITSRVLSPQFMVWILAMAAVVLAFPHTRMRWSTGFVLAAMVPTFLVLDHPEAIVVRNALLVVATVLALVQLGRMLAPRHDVAASSDRTPDHAAGPPVSAPPARPVAALD